MGSILKPAFAPPCRPWPCKATVAKAMTAIAFRRFEIYILRVLPFNQPLDASGPKSAGGLCDIIIPHLEACRGHSLRKPSAARWIRALAKAALRQNATNLTKTAAP